MAKMKNKSHAKRAQKGASLDTFDVEKRRWEDTTVSESLSVNPERRDRFMTGSGEIEVQRLYTPRDVEHVDYLECVGFPGQFPFTRGIEPCGMRAKEWQQYFYTGFGSGDNANERFKALIKAGGNHLQIALDLPTQIGLDSDHP